MTKEQIISKKQVGDWKTLGKILNCESNAARMRFQRGDIEALEAMTQIIENRENLFSKKEN